jgi:hypothetical protein
MSDRRDAETSTSQHKHLQETDIHASSGIQTRNRAALDRAATGIGRE